MPDMPNVPVTPTVTAVPVVVDTKAPVIDTKTAPVTKAVDAKAADAIKTTTAAEKVVINKIKVGDIEYDETTLASMIEKAKGADKKFLEAAQARKEAMRFFKLAKENPREFLEKTGVDPKKFSYDEVAKDIQDKLRDPKEVELEKAQQRLKEYEAKEEEVKKFEAEAKLAREAKAMEVKFHQEIIGALEAHPMIPKNGFSVAKIAKYIDTVREKTGTLLSAEEVASTVENDIRQEMIGLLNGASPEQIIALIGEEGMSAIRKYDLAKLKDPLKGGISAVGNSSDKPKSKRWNSANDFWKSIDKEAKAARGE